MEMEARPMICYMLVLGKQFGFVKRWGDDFFLKPCEFSLNCKIVLTYETFFKQYLKDCLQKMI